MSIRFFRIYDTGDEINLKRLEQALTKSHSISRASFQRVKSKSITMETPPLLIRMEPVCLNRDGEEFAFSVLAKVYDIGAISLCFVYEESDEVTARLEYLALKFSDQQGLDQLFITYLERLQEILAPYHGEVVIDPEFYEDYTVYWVNHLVERLDPLVILMGEKINFSQQLRSELTKYTLSYGADDLAMLSWDTALLCDSEKPSDLIDLIEFANVQLLELRYYDQVLGQQMEKMYDDIEMADRLSRFSRLRTYHALMSRLMETHADVTEITERINNLIKITEDVYYARVYATALQVLRSSQWNDSVNRKINVIHQNYSMLSNEVNIQHSNFLEWMIIVLIALEFIWAIWQALS